MKLTKIDVAEAHLIAAVRMCFRGEHPAPVYLLAASAREILTTIGEKKGLRTMLAGIADTEGLPLKQLIGAASEFVRFFKHADRDTTAVLENFTDKDADVLLFVACHDFHRVAGGMPVELQVFEAWWLASHFDNVRDAPLKRQPAMRRNKQRFMGIRRAPRSEQLRMGREQLERAASNPELVMEIDREVVISGATS